MHFLYKIVFTLLTLNYVLVQGEYCGGILDHDAGQFTASSLELGSTCVWVIKLGSPATIKFQLNSMKSGSVLHVYPEHDPSAVFLQPITLTDADLAEPIATTGQSLVLILVQNEENDSGVSFSWDSIESETLSSVPLSVNYMDKKEGLIQFTKFRPEHKLIVALNLSPFQSKAAILAASVEFEDCPLMNPCECSSFASYEIMPSGLLREIHRTCGRSLSFNEDNLSSKILNFVFINSTAAIGTRGSNSLSLDWNWDDNSTPPPETTVTSDLCTTTVTTENTASTTTTTVVTDPPPPPPFVCLPEEIMSPCKCAVDTISVTCSGGGVNETEFARIWTALRQLNELYPGQWLYLETLEVASTSIKELNLNVIFNFSIEKLSIFDNKKLEKIHGNFQSGQRIIAYEVLLSRNNLTDENLFDFFPYFAPGMTKLTLNGNHLTGGQYLIDDESGDVEFLPGLSKNTNLQEIDLSGENNLEISGGQFKRNRNLKEVEIRNTPTLKLGTDAFLLDPPSSSDPPTLAIWLAGNDLTIYNFNSTGGAVFRQTSRSTILRLSENKLEYLNAVHFKEFLDESGAPKRNLIYGANNRFECDNRMKWLKDGKDKYQSLVFDIDCRNDPGNDVFSTSLID